jgi:hypothetical protein
MCLNFTDLLFLKSSKMKCSFSLACDHLGSNHGEVGDVSEGSCVGHFGKKMIQITVSLNFTPLSLISNPKK